MTVVSALREREEIEFSRTISFICNVSFSLKNYLTACSGTCTQEVKARGLRVQDHPGPYRETLSQKKLVEAYLSGNVL
jgi:hypothetical protein